MELIGNMDHFYTRMQHTGEVLEWNVVKGIKTNPVKYTQHPKIPPYLDDEKSLQRIQSWTTNTQHPHIPTATSMVILRLQVTTTTSTCSHKPK